MFGNFGSIRTASDRQWKPGARAPDQKKKGTRWTGELKQRGVTSYARAHRSRYAPIFSRGTRLPADVIPKIVEYWAHLGWYKYE